MAVVLRGIYRNGRVELKDNPVGVAENSPVLVTFASPVVDLAAVGITPAAAGELRARLAGFGEEWDSAEMEAYDDYDSARAGAQTR